MQSVAIFRTELVKVIAYPGYVVVRDTFSGRKGRQITLQSELLANLYIYREKIEAFIEAQFAMMMSCQLLEEDGKTTRFCIMKKDTNYYLIGFYESEEVHWLIGVDADGIKALISGCRSALAHSRQNCTIGKWQIDGVLGTGPKFSWTSKSITLTNWLTVPYVIDKETADWWDGLYEFLLPFEYYRATSWTTYLNPGYPEVKGIIRKYMDDDLALRIEKDDKSFTFMGSLLDFMTLKFVMMVFWQGEPVPKMTVVEDEGEGII